jgi:hypothetical protein
VFETPVNPVPAGSYTPIRHWLHYADPRMAPTCRSRTGSYLAVGDTVALTHRISLRAGLPLRALELRFEVDPDAPLVRRQPAASGAVEA